MPVGNILGRRVDGVRSFASAFLYSFSPFSCCALLASWCMLPEMAWIWDPRLAASLARPEASAHWTPVGVQTLEQHRSPDLQVWPRPPQEPWQKPSLFHA
jgi:hypothetical protein